MPSFPENPGGEHRGVPPKPHLSREEVHERLRTLGFIIGPETLNYPAGHQKGTFTALQELLAGAIAEWAGIEVDEPGTNPVAELQEWTEEWLVG